MIGVVAFGGALLGMGLVLSISGLRRSSQRPRGSITEVMSRLHSSILPITFCLATGVTVLAITGWPAIAVWMGLLAAVAPRLVRHRSPKAQIERIEALASWAEMIRDTTSAAQGVQGAIMRSGSIAPPSIRPHTMALALNMRSQSLSSA